MPIVEPPRTMIVQSESAARLAGPAKPTPGTIVTVGTQPDSRSSAPSQAPMRQAPPTAKLRASSPSWMRWPPPSAISTIG